MASTTSSRNPGAAMRLLVLGLLQRFGPKHGHAMRQYIHNGCLDQWADVQPGSLYYALEQLAKEGLIQAERTERIGARPPRTVYAITAAGQEEFQRLLVSLLDTIRPLHDSFNLALMFSSAIDDDLLASLVESRIARMRDEVQVLQRGCDFSLSHGYISLRGAEIFRHIQSRLQADVAWHEEFLGKLARQEATAFPDQAPDGHHLFAETPLTACADFVAGGLLADEAASEESALTN
jgi:DNA-binding PadR family transcriptional regulator